MLKELFHRRVPQILGGYLVVIWGVVQFVTFLEGRYTLPPHLVEAVGGGMLLLIPSIALLAYGHGRPGPDEFTKSERVIVPLNVVAALGGAAFFLQSDAALGTVTQTIQVENEEGVVEERVVPKRDYMHRITTFALENTAADPELEYLGYLIPSMLSVHLLQDLSVTVTSPFAYIEHARGAGFPDGRGMPRALQRDIAQQVNSPNYMVGSFESTDAGLSVTIDLLTGPGNSRGKLEATGSNLFAVVDQLAAQLRDALELPAAYLEAVPLLPVEDILTSSADALTPYAEGVEAFALHNDYPNAIAKMNAAIELDPTFCMAHFQLFIIHLLNGDAAELEVAMNGAMKHIYRVPEASQFSIKMNYFYQIKQDGEKAISVGRMWVKLYPDDFDAHGALFQLLNLADLHEEALASVEKLYELDPTRHDLLVQAGDLHSEMNDYDAALSKYQEYAELSPEEPDAFIRIANLMSNYGKLRDALQPLETAQILDPGSINVVLQRARIHDKLGDFAAADADLAEAESLVTTDSQRHSVHDAYLDSHRRRGRAREALEARAKKLTELAKAASPIQVAVTAMMGFQPFLDLGMEEEARAMQAERGVILQGSLAPYASMCYGSLAAESGDLDGAKEHLPRVQSLVVDQKMEMARIPLQMMKSRIAEMEDDLEGATTALEIALESSPRFTLILRELSRLCREQQELGRAREYLDRALLLEPNHPNYLLENARLLHANGKNSDAVAALERALELWSQADDDFFRKVEAETLLAELTQDL